MQGSKFFDGIVCGCGIARVMRIPRLWARNDKVLLGHRFLVEDDCNRIAIAVLVAIIIHWFAFIVRWFVFFAC